MLPERETKGFVVRTDTAGYGGGSRMPAPFFLFTKYKTMTKEYYLKPDEYLSARNWRGFFRSLPDNADGLEFWVRNPQDLMALRVTASQLRDERRYKVVVDFARSTIKVSVNQ